MALLGVRLRDNALPFPAMRELVRLADARGYDSAWLPESQGREVFTELTALVLSSSRLRIGTGIVPVFTRLPTVAAAAMASAAAVAPGRVILGLGIGHQPGLESGHGVHFHHPLQHVKEFVTIARTLLSKGQISFHGDMYTIKHYQLENPPTPPVPVYIAALRPGMLRLAGAIADGVLLNWASLEYIPQAIAYIREGAEAAGRSLSDIQIASYLRTCVTDDPARVEEATRTQIARYSSMLYYQQYFISLGFATEAAAIAQAWQRGDARAAAQAVTQDMIRAITIYGSAEQCRERLQAYRNAGLQLPIIAPFPIDEPVQETFARTITGCL